MLLVRFRKSFALPYNAISNKYILFHFCLHFWLHGMLVHFFWWCPCWWFNFVYIFVNFVVEFTMNFINHVISYKDMYYCVCVCVCAAVISSVGFSLVCLNSWVGIFDFSYMFISGRRNVDMNIYTVFIDQESEFLCPHYITKSLCRLTLLAP